MPTTTAETRVAGENKTVILVVDDYDAGRYAMSRVLATEGYTVLEAATGAEALRKVKEAHPDLVILDVNLPDIDGFEVCQRIKADPYANKLPVLHLSATYVDTMAKVKGLEGGADGYLTQPVEPLVLLATVRALLRLKNAESLAVVEATQWNLTFDAIRDAICLMDPGGRILRFNKAYSELVGKSADEIAGPHCYEIVHGKTAFIENCPFLRALNSSRRESMDAELNGRWFHISVDPVFDQSGKIASCVHIMSDITERKRVDAALAESQGFLLSIVDNSPSLIYALDAAGAFLLINRGLETVFGVPRETLIGKTREAILPPEIAAAHRANDLRVIAEKTPITIEEENDERDGKHTYLSVKFPLFDAHGEVYGVGGISTDVTEHHRLEQQLQQAQKLEGIGQLAGGIAHDFNNILGAVIGFAGVLQMKIAAGDPLRHYADEIVAAGERGAELTRQILAFSRKQVVDLKPVRLNDVVHGLDKMLRRLLPESIDIVHELSGEELGILADTGQLGQVLINLVTNARDAIVGGGKIGIATERLAMDRQYVEAHGYGEPGEYAVLTVTDTGRGMDEATRARVFEPFFTTKEQGKGTGLGMSVVHGIVKQHRGFVNLYSQPGKGTVVRIYIPLSGGAGAQAQSSPPRTPVAGGDETILVAEDDAVLRKLSRTVLGQYGYTVIDAEDGEEAVAKFAAHRDAIRLVILDGLMPKLSGVEALEQIRRLSPDMKALFMSGYDDNTFSSAGLRGKAAFIQKPVMPTDLLRKVREVLDG